MAAVREQASRRSHIFATDALGLCSFGKHFTYRMEIFDCAGALFPAWAYPTFAETLKRTLKEPKMAQLLLISQELG